MERLETFPCEPQPQLATVPDWFATLAREAEQHPRGKAGVAERIGVTRAYVARVMTHNIPLASVSPRFVERVVDSYGGWDCPHTRAHIPARGCRACAAKTYESLSFAEVDQWRACQGCPHNLLRQPQALAAAAAA
uniref:hypothetical protein n=1 Tax=uncultured Sphaerotilus sp. TaxID=474984 RepID=UPI0030CA2850